MRPARCGLATALSLLALGPVLAGCGDDSGGGRTSAWPAAEVSVETRGLVWASGSTIHLGDGTTLDAGTPIRSYVVAQGGAYVVPDTSSDEQPWPELVRVTPGGTERLGVRPESDSLSPSPDGRYLAFLDRSGERDQYDTPVAEAVVVDLRTGDEVLRSDDGMGDPDIDDLTDLYEDATPYVLGVDDDHAWIHTVGDVRSIELATGDVEEVDVDGGITGEPWYDALRTELVPDSPDGAWTIRPREDGEGGEDDGPQLVADDGTTVDARLTPAGLGHTTDPALPPSLAPTIHGWTIDSWLDATTAVGVARVVPPLAADQVMVVITCTVPTGACRVVPGTEEGALLPLDHLDGGVVVPRPLAKGSP